MNFFLGHSQHFLNISLKSARDFLSYLKQASHNLAGGKYLKHWFLFCELIFRCQKNEMIGRMHCDLHLPEFLLRMAQIM